MMKTRGRILISIQQFIMGKYGRDGFLRWLETLPPATKNIYCQRIPDRSWYPLTEFVVKPTESYCDLFFGSLKEGSWECGRYSADLGASRFLKLFIRIGTTNILLQRAKDILPKYYNPCKMELTRADSKSAILKVTEFPEMSEIIEQRIGGFIERAVEISGRDSVTIEIENSLLNGDSSTDYLIDWE